MKNLKPYLAAASFFLLSHTSFAQQVAPLTATQIIDSSIAAMGGREYLESIRTLYTVTNTVMDGRDVQWVTKEMLPNKGAFQIVYKGRVVFENWYDGKKGYEVVNGTKRKADPDEFKDKKYKKGIFDELAYLDPSLWKLELTGEEKVGGEDCYKIRATLVNGAVSMLYFSKKTFLQLREDVVANGEKDNFKTVLFLDYKKFGQLMHYTTMKFGEEPGAQTGTIVNMLINESVTDGDFKK